jgi:hypothetical protein
MLKTLLEKLLAPLTIGGAARACAHAGATNGHVITVFAANVIAPVSLVLKRVENVRSALAGAATTSKPITAPPKTSHLTRPAPRRHMCR